MPETTWRQDCAELKRLRAARPDPDGRLGHTTPESEAINKQINDLINRQTGWRRILIDLI
ncbi:hypothetical protein [Streptomyces albidoflavus]|uniref:hypothetical protein n=1 Tax=Streptomyces albidoflavus TaxID=1886 RepID=UPI00225111ED|nr:hypothetical protein [Streptomyces albidoflavus]MCX4444731.1 hypothetical protein [Streptomyces albidoflavus]